MAKDLKPLFSSSDSGEQEDVCCDVLMIFCISRIAELFCKKYMLKVQLNATHSTPNYSLLSHISNSQQLPCSRI